MNHPLFSEYAPERCTEHGPLCEGAAGGEHIDEPVTFRGGPFGSRCWLCARIIALGNEDWRIVSDSHGQPVVICGRCVEQGDARVEMTYEEVPDAG